MRKAGNEIRIPPLSLRGKRASHVQPQNVSLPKSPQPAKTSTKQPSGQFRNSQSENDKGWGSAIPAERIVTINDFVERVCLPLIEEAQMALNSEGLLRVTATAQDEDARMVDMGKVLGIDIPSGETGRAQV